MQTQVRVVEDEGTGRTHMEIHAIGIELGKTLFHLVAVDAKGNVVVRKRCSRTRLLTYTANVRVRVIGMEACSGAHFLGRALREQGHEVRLMRLSTSSLTCIRTRVTTLMLMPRRSRTAADDGFVPIKTEAQLDLQAVHPVRERWVMRRTAAISQIRGLLLERGLTLPKGRSYLEEALPEISADAASKPSDSFRVLLAPAQDRTRPTQRAHRADGRRHAADGERERSLPGGSPRFQGSAR
jgi:transposase